MKSLTKHTKMHEEVHHGGTEPRRDLRTVLPSAGPIGPQGFGMGFTATSRLPLLAGGAVAPVVDETSGFVLQNYSRSCVTVLRRLLFASLLLVTARAALGVTQFKQGMEAPDFKIKDTAGADVSLSSFRGKTVVLIFGELYHDKTLEACKQIDAVLQDERLKDAGIMPVLVTAQEAKAEDFRTEALKVPMLVLRDTDRKAFGTYQVDVLPSVVVIDKEGHIVSAMGGLMPQMSDEVSDSLLLATGKLSLEQYQKARSTQATPVADETVLKAQRTAALAKQLAQRGLDDLAAEKFAEALKLDGHQITGRIDFGMLLLKGQHFAEAEAQFKAALQQQPGSVEASLGLAYVQAQRGGVELDAAEKTVRDILVRNPVQPRAHFLLGVILQGRGKNDEAMASFKKAAELLLQSQEESMP